MRFKFFTFFKLLALALPLALQPGCTALHNIFSFTSLTARPAPTKTAESLAAAGVEDFNHGRYNSALETFQKLKDRYPFSHYSLLAELKAADCNYFLKNYEEALSLYKEFEKRHPSNEAAPYVVFQIGMCYDKQIDTIDRDTENAGNAIQAFSRLLRTFPASPYSEEARFRIKTAQDFLANHEFYVATFYVKTNSLAEAEGRLEYLLSNYPTSAVTPSASKLLADLKADNPPKRSWRSWVPGAALFDKR